MAKVYEIIEMIGLQNLIIGCIALLAFIIFLIIFKSVRLKHYKKKIVDIENAMNAAKSLPIQYKLGRAQNICQNISDLREQYESLQKEYDALCEFQSTQLAVLENEVDEQIFLGKTSKVSKKMKELVKLNDEYINRSNTLLKEVEKITEVENVHRVRIIEVKDQFRAVQDHYNAVSNVVGEFVPNYALSMNKIDSDFVKLEDYMNNQKFEEAGKFTEEISDQIDELDAEIQVLPDYVTVVKQYIPKKINAFNALVETMEFSLDALNVVERLTQTEKSLDESIVKIKSLDLEPVAEILESIIAGLDSLTNDVNEEKEAYEKFTYNWNEYTNSVASLFKRYNSALKEYDRFATDYVLDNQDITIKEEHQEFEELLEEAKQINDEVESKAFSYKDVLEKISIIVEKVSVHEGYIAAFEQTLIDLRRNEERCISELENINIVLLEIKSEIKNKHLPMINESYKDYISESYAKAADIQEFRAQKPVDMKVLTEKTNEVRDVIYQLYENIHNLCVTAQMVEEAIVFGNRYRSSFLEVNTELTKAEILFRNGEYTSALTTVVDIIEKIKPGSYEELIKKGEKSA